MNVNQILSLAQDSVFYRNEDGIYRIQYTEFAEGEEGFNVIDEDSGEEYKIEPCDVKDTDSFYVTTEVKVGSPKPSIEDVLLALRKLYDYDTHSATPAEKGTYEAEVLGKCKEILDQF